MTNASLLLIAVLLSVLLVGLYWQFACQLPERYDGARAPGVAVQYQSTCGSCWALSAVTASQYRLWQQQGVDARTADCEDVLSNTPGNHGCMGGSIQKAYRYCRDTGVLVQGSRYRQKYFANLAGRSICTIKKEIMRHGPVTAFVLQYPSMKSLRPGVSWTPQPGERAVGGHAVVICGWDDRKGGWLVQNSWGEGWCDRGRGVFAYGAGGIDSLHVYAGYF